jgi:hypothetical protein
MVLECAFDDLVEKIGSDDLINTWTHEVCGEELTIQVKMQATLAGWESYLNIRYITSFLPKLCLIGV